jgi:MinD-like ATPase involved in chromosome partitioning or flagellar assembly
VISRVISIAGAKGSPGCSFLALALSRCFAARGIPTLLVDGDAEGGGLASMLDVVTRTPPGEDRRVSLDESAIQIETHLEFADLGAAEDARINGLEIAVSARARHKAVVVDLGHSAASLQRQLSAASDWLLWVVVPNRSGLERADRALASGALGAANAGLVFNRVARGSLSRADEVLSSRHRMPVMARIKEDPRDASRLWRGLGRGPGRGQPRAVRDLACSIHPNIRPAARAWH